MVEELPIPVPKHCPFCGETPEVKEWENGNYPIWQAKVQCRCGASGPVRNADNHLGCFDAVKGLHKIAAVTDWNKRSKPKAKLLTWAVKLNETYKPERAEAEIGATAFDVLLPNGHWETYVTTSATDAIGVARAEWEERG